MTDKQLWVGVGRVLQQARAEAGFNTCRMLSHKSKRDCPDERTLRAIERGEPGTVDSVTLYCHVLRTSLVDVLRVVLGGDGGGSFSREAMRVALGYERADAPRRRAIGALLQDGGR